MNNEQYVKIQRYQDEMIELLGTDIWHRIERIPQIRSCKPSMLKIIAEKIEKLIPIGQQIAMLYKTIIHGNGGML